MWEHRHARVAWRARVRRRQAHLARRSDRARERLRGSRLSISDYDGVSQFAGNGTAAYPPLYNRNLIGFFPFQVTAHKWVIPTYVMTQDTVTLTLQDH